MAFGTCTELFSMVSQELNKKNVSIYDLKRIDEMNDTKEIVKLVKYSPKRDENSRGDKREH